MAGLNFFVVNAHIFINLDHVISIELIMAPHVAEPYARVYLSNNTNVDVIGIDMIKSLQRKIGYGE